MRSLTCALLLLAACASRRPTAATPVLDVARLGPDRPASDDLVIRFPAGTRLPVDLRVDTPFVHAEGGPATTLVFDRTVYWYVGDPRLISFDGESWSRIGDSHRGRLDLAVSASAGRAAVASVKVALASLEASE